MGRVEEEEEEEEEEEPRRDAAISTNCDMLPPSHSLLQQASSHVGVGCENFVLHFLFERTKPDGKGKFWQNLNEFYCCD